MKNTIEELLSETADFLEKRLAGDPELCENVTVLCNQGQKPHILRFLADVSEGAVFITIGKPEMLPST